MENEISPAELDAILADVKLMWTSLGDVAMQVPGAAETVGPRRFLPQIIDMVFDQAKVALNAPTAGTAVTLPAGYKLLKDSTFNERSWPEDANLENGNYYCICCICQRQFGGHKRRALCKVCDAEKVNPHVAPSAAGTNKVVCPFCNPIFNPPMFLGVDTARSESWTACTCGKSTLAGHVVCDTKDCPLVKSRHATVDREATKA